MPQSGSQPRSLNVTSGRRSRTDPEPSDALGQQTRQERTDLRDRSAALDTTRAEEPDPAAAEVGCMPLRFALYGYALEQPHNGRRPHAEQWWDQQTARTVIEPRGGKLVAEYFDILSTHDGEPIETSQTSWGQRPQARALIDALPADTFDAVIIARVTFRTFAATPLWDVVELLAHHGKQLWTGEIGGPLDPASRSDVLLMKILAAAAEPGSGQVAFHRSVNPTAHPSHTDPR
ncbi:hypothetical protein ACFVH6_23390 [Spirillospora sp. NPDC127200]